MVFDDKDLAELKALDHDVPSHMPIPCMVFGRVWIHRLINRLEVAEKIVEGLEMTHPEDENCGCSTCDLLKEWRRTVGK